MVQMKSFKATFLVLMTVLFNALRALELPSFDECGKTTSTLGHVHNGLLARPLDFPWVGSIVKVESETLHNIHCQVSLITKFHVLTACHCFDPPHRSKIADMYVVLGTTTPLEIDFKRERRTKINYVHEIDEVILHSNYKQGRAYHDVALVKLQKEVKLRLEYVYPICLPLVPENVDERIGEAFYVTGFITNDPETTGQLHYIRPKSLKQSQCNSAYDLDEDDDDKPVIDLALPKLFQPSVFCMKSDVGDQGTCRGDSGGPLFDNEYYNDTTRDSPKVVQTFMQFGTIHGSGRSCDGSRFPGIYVRLTEATVLEFLRSLGQKNGNSIFTAPDKVDCRWSLWSECSTSENCEGGVQKRRITREAKNGGKDCENKNEVERPCNRKSCPIIGAKEVTLKIASGDYCGGNDIRLSFENQNKKCFTAEKGGFSAGDLLTWKGSELSGCKAMVFDSVTTVKVESKSSNQFCPRLLTVKSEQSSKFIWFYTKISDGFHQAAIHNNIEHQLRGPTALFTNAIVEIADFESKMFFFNNKLYRFSKETKSHEGAQRICANNGGRLFEPRNKKENNEVADVGLEIYKGNNWWWIGVDNKDREGRFQWSSNKENINFSNWWKGEPGNKGNQVCINISANFNSDYHGTWGWDLCNFTRRFICEFT